MSKLTADEFLTEVLKDLREGLTGYQNDRKNNPELNDAEFLHHVGTSLSQLLAENAINPRQAVLTTATAMYRITQLEEALRDAAEGFHSVTGHGPRNIEDCRADVCADALNLLNAGKDHQ